MMTMVVDDSTRDEERKQERKEEGKCQWLIGRRNDQILLVME